MKFTYASGSRPLEGYTIKRGVGRGGFGEVYFATSDAGKEVALKLIRRNLDVELRGVTQCLNLKHPNLISLYDIRTDDVGDQWVVMEYVSGESLEDVIDRSPNGMPADQALAWMHGIVRRRGLSARPRHRPSRPEAGQHLLRRRHGQDRRLRPVEVHLLQPPQRTDRKRRHRPLHGARNRQRPLRPRDRHLRPRHHPVRNAHRPRAVRGRERRRSADEAPHGRARSEPAQRTVSRHRAASPGQGSRRADQERRRDARGAAGWRKCCSNQCGRFGQRGVWRGSTAGRSDRTPVSPDAHAARFEQPG